MGDGEYYDSALSGEPTELAPSVEETSAHTAWALDDGPEWRPPFWTAGRITAAVAGAAVVAVVAAAGVVGYHLRSEPAPVAAPVATTTVPVITTTVQPPPPPMTTTTVAPPPATVTVTKEAPRTAQTVAAPSLPLAPTFLPDLAPFDGVFMSTIQIRGWEVWDGQLMLERAHSTCSMMRDGEPQGLIAAKLVGVERQLTLPLANNFINTVRDVYPNCP